MTQMIYKTRRKKTLVSENTNLFCALFTFIMIGLMFLVMFTTGMNPVIAVFLFIILIAWIMLIVAKKFNWSASTCLIGRDNKLYVIRLFGTGKMVDKKGDIPPIYARAGSAEQALTLGHNINVAMRENSYRKQLNAMRRDDKNYIDGLDSVLEYLETHSRAYKVKPNNKRTLSERILFYESENEGFERIRTELGEYGFLKLNNPEIAENKFGALKIKFYNEQKKECTVKISDCYDGLKEDIRAGLYS